VSQKQSSSEKSLSLEFQIPFHHADPAGIAFFAHIFTYAHTAYEAFVQELGISWNEWFLENPYLVPIRHTSADYFGPFQVGHIYRIQACVKSMSKTSFQMQYDFFSGKEPKALAQVLMVHTFVNKKSKEKAEIPKDIKSKLEGFLAPALQERP
jgi:YbgC/YbaW family acyl-CoA thioester hydrolase